MADPALVAATIAAVALMSFLYAFGIKLMARRLDARTAGAATGLSYAALGATGSAILANLAFLPFESGFARLAVLMIFPCTLLLFTYVLLARSRRQGFRVPKREAT